MLFPLSGFREVKMNKEPIKQFIKFGLVGVSNTLISQIVYMACIALGAHYLVASIIAFILSVLNAYVLQNIFVFKQDESLERRSWWQVLLKTYAAYAFTGLLLNNLLLILWIDIIKIERFTVILTDIIVKTGVNIENRKTAEYIAPLLNIAVNVPINFVINKFWAYRQKENTYIFDDRDNEEKNNCSDGEEKSDMKEKDKNGTNGEGENL